MELPKPYPVEVHHSARSTTIVALLPRVQPSDVQIRVEAERVLIDAESAENAHHIDIPLGIAVDAKRAEMNLSGGVLRLFLPLAS